MYVLHMFEDRFPTSHQPPVHTSGREPSGSAAALRQATQTTHTARGHRRRSIPVPLRGGSRRLPQPAGPHGPLATLHTCPPERGEQAVAPTSRTPVYVRGHPNSSSPSMYSSGCGEGSHVLITQRLGSEHMNRFGVSRACESIGSHTLLLLKPEFRSA